MEGRYPIGGSGTKRWGSPTARQDAGRHQHTPREGFRGWSREWGPRSRMRPTGFAAWVSRKQRKIVGLTQEELSERAGISPRTLRRSNRRKEVQQDPIHAGRSRRLGAVEGQRDRLQFKSRQLPADIGVFAGTEHRTGRADRIAASRSQRGTTEPSTRHPDRLRSAPPGWGEDALVIRWAHRVRADFPDGTALPQSARL